MSSTNEMTDVIPKAAPRKKHLVNFIFYFIKYKYANYKNGFNHLLSFFFKYNIKLTIIYQYRLLKKMTCLEIII